MGNEEETAGNASGTNEKVASFFVCKPILYSKTIFEGNLKLFFNENHEKSTEKRKLSFQRLGLNVLEC